jgi:hypothetical protein
MKSRWIEHKGKRIFIADFSNFDMDSDALKEECDAIIEILNKEPYKSVRAISNVEGTVASSGNLALLKQLIPVTTRHIYKRCVVGLTGTRLAFLSFFERISGGVIMTPIATFDEALEWIVKDD